RERRELVGAEPRGVRSAASAGQHECQAEERGDARGRTEGILAESGRGPAPRTVRGEHPASSPVGSDRPSLATAAREGASPKCCEDRQCGIAKLTPSRYWMYAGWIVTAPAPSCWGTPYCFKNRAPPSMPQRPKFR